MNWAEELGLKEHEIPFFMFKGGSVQPTDPMKDAEAKLLIQRDQQAYEDKRRAAEEAAALAERQRQEEKAAKEQQEKVTRFNDSKASTMAAARAYGQNKVNNLGVADTYGLLDSYAAQLGLASNSVPYLSEEVGKYISPEAIWNNVKSDAVTGQRNKLRNQINQFFSPGYESSDAYFADTSDDQYLNDILNEQQSEAQAVIDRAAARGTLNEAGKTYASKEMNKARTKGMGMLTDIGNSVLAGYRKSLTDATGALNSRAAAWDLGDNFNIDSEKANIDRMAAGYKNRMQGDILSKVGDTSLFDTDLIVGKAGNAMGATNGTSPLVAAFTPTEEQKKAASGLVTNTGAI